jgi:hypothetical protein
MQRLLLLVVSVGCLAATSHAQYPAADWPDADTPPPFEVCALASGMRTVDATPTLVIKNPAPNQSLGFTPSGVASGAQVGFVWRQDNIGLVADLGFHKYSDRTGSTTLAPLMLGIRVYSDEHFRTSFFGEGLAGAYRWTERADKANFTTVKGIVATGGGMDIRLTRRLVFRVFEIQLMIAGAGAGPLLTSRASTGIAVRF